MPSFGVVVCITFFLPSAYPAPALTSDNLSLLKLGDTERKSEELRRLETEKSEEYGKEIDDILKKLLLYINTHFKDTSREVGLKCETIKGDKENFVFYKVKGKIFPKRKPIYVAEIRSAIGSKKYFEICPKKTPRIKGTQSTFNGSPNVQHVTLNKSKEENLLVKEESDEEAQSTNKNNLEEPLSLTTKSFLFKNENTVKKLVSKTSHININVSNSDYIKQKLSKNITQSLPISIVQKLDNDTKINTTNKFTKSDDTKLFSLNTSPVTMAVQPSFYSISSSPDTQINKYVTESENEQYSFDNKSSQWNSTSATYGEESSPYIKTPNVENSNLTQNGEEIQNMSTYQTTNEHYILKLVTYPYLTTFKVTDENNKPEKGTNDPIKGITSSSSVSNESEKKVSQNHFLILSSPTSSTIADKLTTFHEAVNSTAFIDIVPGTPEHIFDNFKSSSLKSQLRSSTPFHLKQNDLSTENYLQTNHFQSSSVTDLSNTHSTEANGSFSDSLDRYYKINISSTTLSSSEIPLITYGNNRNNSTEQTKSSSHFISSSSLNTITTEFSKTLNISTQAKEKSTSSIEENMVSDFESEPNEDNATTTQLDGIEVTKSVTDTGNSVFNYSITMTDMEAFDEKTFSPSITINHTRRTSAVFESLSETPHYDLQETTQSDETEFIPIQNRGSEPTTNVYNTSSPVYESKKSYYLTAEVKSDHMGSTTAGYSQTFSSLPSTVHNVKENQSVNFQSERTESRTTQIIHESTANTLPVLPDYPTETTEEFSQSITYFTSSLAKFTSEIPINLTDMSEENSGSHSSNRKEGPAASDYENNTKIPSTSSSVIIGSRENSSLNYSSWPHTSSSIIHFGFTDSTGDNSPQSGAFSHEINSNHTVINDKANFTSGEAFVHDTYPTNNSHLSDSQPVSTTFDNGNITKGVTVISDNIYRSNLPKHLTEKPDQPTFDYLVTDKIETLIGFKTNDYYSFTDSIIENTRSTTETVEDEKDKNQFYPFSKAEKLTSNKPSISGDMSTIQQTPKSSIISSFEIVYPTIPLIVSPKMRLDGSTTEISITPSNTVNPINNDLRNYTIVTGTNETTTYSITVGDTDNKTNILTEKNENFSYSNYLTTLDSDINTEETLTLTPESKSSISTANKQRNLTIQEGSDKISSSTEIQNTSENAIRIETTTQRYTQDNVNLKLSSTTVGSAEKSNFTYTEKSTTIVNNIENVNMTLKETSKDTIKKTTPDSVTLKFISNKYDDKNNKSSVKKTTTNSVMISSAKNSETLSTSDKRNNFETSTQSYQTTPSFNNFTFLLPTTDYLTSYLPLRIHPFIVFGEIK